MELIQINEVNIPNRDFYIDGFYDVRGWVELLRETIGEAAASLFEKTFNYDMFGSGEAYDQGYDDGYKAAKEESQKGD